MVQTFSQQPNPLPDRKALDDVVFCAKGASASGGDALGLTEAERKEVYWAACLPAGRCASWCRIA
jgi:hypothetical protein